MSLKHPGLKFSMGGGAVSTKGARGRNFVKFWKRAHGEEDRLYTRTETKKR